MSKKYKVCIDAGHGGSDPGACSGGCQEKNITLELAISLKKQLLKQGFDVVMTRETDVYDTPTQKARLANATYADIFISLHCNAASDEGANGIETLCYDKPQSDGFRLAKLIQTEVVLASGLRDRGVKERRNLIVLNSTTMPAVMLEGGFLSNKNERLLLLDDSFRRNIAQAVTKAVCRYFDVSFTESKLSFNLALDILSAQGIVASPAYWVVKAKEDEYLQQLIINVGQALSSKGV